MTPEQQTQHANRLEGKITQLEALCETLRFSAKTGKGNEVLTVTERMVNILVSIAETEEKKQAACQHDYKYKILHDHTACDICSECGHIKKQQSNG